VVNRWATGAVRGGFVPNPHEKRRETPQRPAFGIGEIQAGG
jgi:hypothetical protein